ncbi:hypothetical protein CsatA_026839 [Cannabis sativa]
MDDLVGCAPTVELLKLTPFIDRSAGVSSFSLLAAQRCASKARSLPRNQVTKLFTLINGRTKLDPPLQPHLFANVLYATSTVVTIGDLINNPINYGASKIRQTLVKMDNSYLRSAIDYLELRPNLINGPGRGADVYESPNFGVVCWIGLPMYDSDFGWGRPFYVTPVGLRLEGKAYILPPGPINNGNLFVAIALKVEHVKVFEKLLYDGVCVGNSTL